MANVSLRRADTSRIEATVNAIATQVTRPPGFRLSGFTAYPLGERDSGNVFGDGFTYDASGRLAGGTISSFLIQDDGNPGNAFRSSYTVSVSGFSLPVQQAVALASAPGGATPVLLAGRNAVSLDHNAATLYGGDDTITVLGNGAYINTGLVVPHRKRPGRPLLAGEEADNAEHRKVRARVEHTFARMKNYKILRDCRQRGDGLHHAVQAVATMHNLAITA